MNKKVCIIVLVIIMVSTLISCSPTNNEPTEEPTSGNLPSSENSQDSENDESRKIATFVIDTDPENINYHAVAGSNTEVQIMMATSDFLCLYNPETGKYEGRLLESWEHNEDYTVWTMHVREGVKWHDGHDFTAHDIAFTYKYKNDPNLDTYQMEGNKDNEEVIEVVDNYTYKVITEFPNPNELTDWTNVLPKHIWENVDPSNFSKAEEGYLMIGNGPYKMVEYKVGEYIKFEAFDEYYGGKPKIDTIYYRIIGDKTASIAALESGQIDFVIADATSAERIVNNSNILTWKGSSGNVSHLNMNNKREPFNDIRVRQAIAHLVNREVLVEQAMNGYAEPAYTDFAPTDIFYNPDITTKYEFSIEKAIALLEEAGYTKGSDGIMEKDGKKLEFSIIAAFPQAETAVLIMAQDFIKAGIKVTPQTLDRNSLFALWDTHDYDMMIGGTTMGPDPSRYQYIYVAEDNIMQYEDEEMNQLFSDALAASNEKDKKETYEKIQKKISDEVPNVYLWYRDTVYGYNKNLVIDDAGTVGFIHFRFLHMEKLYFKD